MPWSTVPRRYTLRVRTPIRTTITNTRIKTAGMQELSAPHYDQTNPRPGSSLMENKQRWWFVKFRYTLDNKIPSVFNIEKKTPLSCWEIIDKARCHFGSRDVNMEVDDQGVGTIRFQNGNGCIILQCSNNGKERLVSLFSREWAGSIDRFLCQL